MGILTVKCLKPDVIATIFERCVDFLQASSSQCRPLSERREQRLVKPLHVHNMVCVLLDITPKEARRSIKALVHFDTCWQESIK